MQSLTIAVKISNSQIRQPALMCWHRRRDDLPDTKFHQNAEQISSSVLKERFKYERNRAGDIEFNSHLFQVQRMSVITGKMTT